MEDHPEVTAATFGASAEAASLLPPSLTSSKSGSGSGSAEATEDGLPNRSITADDASVQSQHGTNTTLNTIQPIWYYNNTTHNINNNDINNDTNNSAITITKDNIQICFLTTVYGDWVIHADRLQNVSHDVDFWSDRRYHHSMSASASASSPRSPSSSSLQPSESQSKSQFHFFVATNLPKYPAEQWGWTKLMRPYPHSNFTRYITLSRVMKFWAWNDPYIQHHCHVVLYMDSIGHILGSADKFRQLAMTIYRSESGHAQYRHRGGGGAWGEFRRIEVFQKDLPEHIQASKAWLSNQSDFRPPSQHNCTLYENRYIGYAVGRPTTFAHAVEHCFWPRYHLELDSWRDQPLWCYCLDKYNITPLSFEQQQQQQQPQQSKLWKLQPSRMGRHGHKYKSVQAASVKTKETNAGKNVSKQTKQTNKR